MILDIFGVFRVIVERCCKVVSALAALGCRVQCYRVNCPDEPRSL